MMEDQLLKKMLLLITDQEHPYMSVVFVVYMLVTGTLAVVGVVVAIQDSSKRRLIKKKISLMSKAFELAAARHEDRKTEECLKLVDDNQLDLNRMVTGFGHSIFMAACLSCNMTLVQLMLDRGANIKARSENGDSPLYLITFRCICNDELTDTQLLLFFINLGCDVNDQNVAGLTPLHLSAWKGSIHLVKFFLEHGADHSIRDRKGRTAAHLARLQGHGPVCAYLEDLEYCPMRNERDHSYRSPRDSIHNRCATNKIASGD
ncbi:ankyrin repeat and death domain-containing protein 1B-like [Ornithodoros turicata]|uniref:ankyrin repeat and death domain-containing protein 1B-like n=1 Tax=Ornithodoros turicata TaxID=34597 RepID=UPI0031395DD7